MIGITVQIIGITVQIIGITVQIIGITVQIVGISVQIVGIGVFFVEIDDLEQLFIFIGIRMRCQHKKNLVKTKVVRNRLDDKNSVYQFHQG